MSESLLKLESYKILSRKVALEFIDRFDNRKYYRNVLCIDTKSDYKVIELARKFQCDLIRGVDDFGDIKMSPIGRVLFIVSIIVIIASALITSILLKDKWNCADDILGCMLIKLFAFCMFAFFWIVPMYSLTLKGGRSFNGGGGLNDKCKLNSCINTVVSIYLMICVVMFSVVVIMGITYATYNGFGYRDMTGKVLVDIIPIGIFFLLTGVILALRLRYLRRRENVALHLEKTYFCFDKGVSWGYELHRSETEGREFEKCFCDGEP